MNDSKEIKHFFSAEQEQDLMLAIRRAEEHTSGEIRVHFEAKCPGDAFKRGLEVFTMLEMHKTKLRNGVLFYIAMETQKFAIIADQGIHEKVTEGFWNEIRDEMASFFRQNNLIEGLKIGVVKAGKALKDYFPFEDGDINELSDQITTS
jgi:uncharacterized membrane protein